MFQVLVATYVSCPLSTPRAISAFVPRECSSYLPAHAVVSPPGEAGLAGGGRFCGAPGNSVASVFGSTTFILTIGFDSVLLSKDLS